MGEEERMRELPDQPNLQQSLLNLPPWYRFSQHASDGSDLKIIKLERRHLHDFKPTALVQLQRYWPSIQECNEAVRISEICAPLHEPRSNAFPLMFWNYTQATENCGYQYL
jgi:hypothetical protein